MWKEKVELPRPVMTVDEIVDLLVAILDERTAREVAESMEAYWRPVYSHLDE